MTIPNDDETSNDAVLVVSDENNQETASVNGSQMTQTATQTQRTTSNNKPFLIKGVEQVALSHYIHKTNWYTHGKHAETATLRTLFGLIFWDILFDSSVPNVFVDRFQTAPLDLQTDFFYSSRKQTIDAKLDLLSNAPIDLICELISHTWDTYR